MGRAAWNKLDDDDDDDDDDDVYLHFTARQHAEHAERDIVLAILSVRLSVCPSRCGIVLSRLRRSRRTAKEKLINPICKLNPIAVQKWSLSAII